MPQRTPLTRKGKEKVRNRALKSSASPESKDEGQDAPLEPICDFFFEPSLSQAEERNLGMAEEQRESKAAQETKPFTAEPDKSSRSKKGAAKHSGKKHKQEEISQGKGKPSEVSTPRVTRQQKKIHKSDSGDSPMIESMAASSLVELSTSSKKVVPLSLSQQPLASSAPLGRVTRSRAKAHGITNAPSPSTSNKEIVFVNLGTEDATTIPAEMDPVTIPPTPTDPPAKETAAKETGAHLTSPVERGKTKLQFYIECKVEHLEE